MRLMPLYVVLKSRNKMTPIYDTIILMDLDTTWLYHMSMKEFLDKLPKMVDCSDTDVLEGIKISTHNIESEASIYDKLNKLHWSDFGNHDSMYLSNRTASLVLKELTNGDEKVYVPQTISAVGYIGMIPESVGDMYRKGNYGIVRSNKKITQDKWDNDLMEFKLFEKFAGNVTDLVFRKDKYNVDSLYWKYGIVQDDDLYFDVHKVYSRETLTCRKIDVPDCIREFFQVINTQRMSVGEILGLSTVFFRSVYVDDLEYRDGVNNISHDTVYVKSKLTLPRSLHVFSNADLIPSEGNSFYTGDGPVFVKLMDGIDRDDILNEIVLGENCVVLSIEERNKSFGIEHIYINSNICYICDNVARIDSLKKITYPKGGKVIVGRELKQRVNNGTLRIVEKVLY